ncbi:TPA: peptide-methionine (S)-S-oxide reductase MsrA [Pasteurella multocida]|uniref:peptide-methionine (S)-S-oxide reductase MsrA n=1 Tax=Pasteurella multocida TaxID=747 RepID=UPI00021449EC|nr:peptide-methionine (S)-S-oxide reductase MsrA [Pasteurella multocida]EGP01946.1 methionine sulfoxide reductase A [Pasteurella multocida subsp. multocida str. Anand1_goat]AFF23887.1 peptide methionine sulfoxide reductase MsrA [Pasteurella multocida subsp. multocida str. HN06]MCL7775418.1 peptide-methionine (S)-S-oxide reductase MsrA [Pasteurella multocida]MCL8063816.1 peptide-methionine (S)-S-oxide reductase MsrA [Pasteurella multocida]MCL8065933.1 peptide-methionine (S)-S-oxide reductase Ms
MTQQAIFAGGCFWCVEAVFNQIKGVEKATSGYINGTTENPTYKEVCTGETGHAEAVKVEFDATVISYEKLLDIFFSIHNPTQLNHQGEDVGTQYRTGIYYLNAEQEQLANNKIAELQPHFAEKIVTEVLPAQTFYPAEDYHQGYLLQNPQNSYCNLVATPKFLKAKVKFEEIWK